MAVPDLAPQSVPLTACDLEPIHVPGAVQGRGALVAFDDDGRIVYRSQNLGSLLQVDEEALGSTIGDLLGSVARERLTSAADEADVSSAPESLVLPSERLLNATAHRSDGLVVVEFELPASAETQRLLVHDLRQAVQSVVAARGVAVARTAAVEEVRRLTGYDRVMVYRFHEDEHGEVIAEARRRGLESYLGFHYPATDIPHPARRLLRLSPIRLIADVDATDVPIKGHGAFSGRPLDLSRSGLRAVSPIHLQYLRNMGVAASLTISLMDGPRLWGLIACHHAEPKLVSPEIRSACAIVASILWQAIEADERRDLNSQRQRRSALYARFLATISSVESLADALVQDGHSLLEFVGAQGLFLRIDQVSACLGVTPPPGEVDALVTRLAELQPTLAVVTDETGAFFPELSLEAASATGILAAPIESSWQEHLIWFRGETARDLTWAGNPAKPASVQLTESPGSGADMNGIGPRTSFAAWREVTRGHSAPWTRSDLDAASEFVAALPGIRIARERDGLVRLALRDSLTGLPNRTWLRDRIEAALVELQHRDGDMWVLFLDLDGFKEINDSLGHDAGDQVLIEIASRLRRTVRASDTVARLAGDEFVIVSTEHADVANIEELATRLLQSVAEPMVVLGRTCAVSASIGMAAIDRTWDTAAALSSADGAMYRAKSLGRNRASR